VTTKGPKTHHPTSKQHKTPSTYNLALKKADNSSSTHNKTLSKQRQPKDHNKLTHTHRKQEVAHGEEGSRSDAKQRVGEAYIDR
jgi:hypothetical protein